MLNHSPVVGLLRLVVAPVALGRSLPTAVFERSTPSEMYSGKPLEKVTMELSSQPPAIALATPWLRKRRPLPNGGSYSTELTKRCRASKIDRPRSQLMQVLSWGCTPSVPIVRTPLPSSSDFEY